MAKKTKYDIYNFSDKVVRGFLLAIWGILIIFGILTIIQPKWLADMSKPGRKEEALSYIDGGNKFMYNANQKNSVKNYEMALINYKKALEIDSLNIDAMANIGVTYLYLNKLEEAKEKFEKCLKIDTVYSYHIFAYLGDYYEKKGEIEKALEQNLISAKTHPNPSYPLRKAGLFCMQLLDFDKAVKYLNQSIIIEKSFENFYKGELIDAKYKAISNKDTINIKIISKELQNKNFDEDLKRYDKYIFEQTHKISKDIAYAYLYLGDVYSYKLEFAAAAENYQLSLQYYPAFTEKIKDKLALALEKAKK